MKSLAHGVVKWFGMEGDIESMVKDCHQCQVHCNSPVPAHAGPFLDKQFLVVVVDAHLKWLEVIHVPNLTSQTTISTL